MGSTFGEKLKRIREYKKMTQEDFATLLGTSKQVISRYENNQRTPKITIAVEYADKLGVASNYLIDDSVGIAVSNVFSIPHTVKKPRLGTIACGVPITAVENIDVYDDVPDGIKCDFTLGCKGDSMIGARIYDGDIVYIREQPDVENGEIAAVIIDDGDCEVTLKRVKKVNGKIILWPENSNYEPMIFAGEDINKLRIIGKAVFFMSKVR